MKKGTGFMGMLALALTFGLLVYGCASSGGSTNNNLVAGSGETLVIVQRESSFIGAAIKYEIHIDEKKALELANGATDQVVVPNGVHAIYAKMMRPIAGKPESVPITFTADSTDLYFTVKPAGNKIILTAER
jgi:hypothetical protein